MGTDDPRSQTLLQRHPTLVEVRLLRLKCRGFTNPLIQCLRTALTPPDCDGQGSLSRGLADTPGCIPLVVSAFWTSPSAIYILMRSKTVLMTMRRRECDLSESVSESSVRAGSRIWLAGDSWGGSEATYQMLCKRPIGHTLRSGWKAVTRLSPDNA